jgi:hypothetical protein
MNGRVHKAYEWEGSYTYSSILGGFLHLQVGIISLQREIDGYKVPSTYINKISPMGKRIGNSKFSFVLICHYPFVLTWQLPLHFILKKFKPRVALVKEMSWTYMNSHDFKVLYLNNKKVHFDQVDKVVKSSFMFCTMYQGLLLFN